ncbi:uncharacterized protein ARMOST_10065 [Armillaria ostoyae]|uniref:Uncharacterized protein n=1 Tax=Armillaria ostoyae TaxID=47428 RepID=A0A284RD98_ARMOS|nr:uncharacterized protein ARMOST_10065 [Armillaria ostoyae]
MYRQNSPSLLAKYHTQIRDLFGHPHMRVMLGMGGTTGLLSRLFGKVKLVCAFMDRLLVIICQHLQGNTDTNDADSKGLIWDRVNASEINVLHGYMSSGKEEDQWIFPTYNILDSEMLKEWEGLTNRYVHEVFRKIAADLELGKVTARTHGEW